MAVIGTAGWSISRDDAGAFPAGGTSLERYAAMFGGVEVNSSFHRAHRPLTWARWAASVPEGFRFSVKIPKTITHAAKLVEVDALIDRFAQEIAPLGPKLAILLVQLPPKLAVEPDVAERFFTMLRAHTTADLVCEPRHASWFDDAALDTYADQLRGTGADAWCIFDNTAASAATGNALTLMRKVAET